MSYIIEKGDTIGWHYIYIEPTSDSAIDKWTDLVYKGMYDNYKPDVTYSLKGEFLGKQSGIMYSVTDNRIYIFNQNELLGIYQYKTTPSGFIRKKNRITAEPYLLVKANLEESERIDILRLAMVGLCFKNISERYH